MLLYIPNDNPTITTENIRLFKDGVEVNGALTTSGGPVGDKITEIRGWASGWGGGGGERIPHILSNWALFNTDQCDNINEIFNKTGIPANRMRGYLAGRITIPDYVSDRIKQLGENNDD